MANETDKRLSELTTRLTQAFGDRLLSVVLYGSAASGEMHGKYSDLNVLCVLKTIGPAELRLAESPIRWWRSLNNPSPLFLSEEEFYNSTDCFAIEFHDIVECHRVLAGADLVTGLVVDDTFYRGQVEHAIDTDQCFGQLGRVGNITDVKMEYPDDLVKQMLYYGEKHSFLPDNN